MTADGWIMHTAEVWVEHIRTLPVARAVLCTTDVPRSNSKHSYLAGLSITLGKRISSGKSSQEKCNDIGLHCSGREGSFGVTKIADCSTLGKGLFRTEPNVLKCSSEKKGIKKKSHVFICLLSS